MSSTHEGTATPSRTPSAASPTPPVPSSFVHFANRDTDTGRKVAGLLGRFVAGPLALPDEVARELGRDRARADPLSDAFIDAAFERGSVGKTRALVEQALADGIGAVTDAPP